MHYVFGVVYKFYRPKKKWRTYSNAEVKYFENHLLSCTFGTRFNNFHIQLFWLLISILIHGNNALCKAFFFLTFI